MYPHAHALRRHCLLILGARVESPIEHQHAAIDLFLPTTQTVWRHRVTRTGHPLCGALSALASVFPYIFERLWLYTVIPHSTTLSEVTLVRSHLVLDCLETAGCLDEQYTNEVVSESKTEAGGAPTNEYHKDGPCAFLVF